MRPLKRFQRVVNALILRDVLRRAQHLVQREIRLVDFPEQVFQIDDTHDIVKLLGGHGINIEQILLNLLPDFLGCIRHIQPNQLATMRHDRTHVPVAQVEDTLHEVLLNLLHLSTIETFFHDRLDLFLRHLILLACIDAGHPYRQRRTLRQEPNKRRRYQGKEIHRLRDQHRSPLGACHTNSLRDQLAKNQREIRHDNDNGRFRDSYRVRLQGRYSRDDLREIIRQGLSRVQTRQDAY